MSPDLEAVVALFRSKGPRVQEVIFYGTGRGTGFTEGTRLAFFLRKSGAGDGIRTRNPQLGKLMRYRCATPAQVEEKIIKPLLTVNARNRFCLVAG